VRSVPPLYDYVCSAQGNTPVLWLRASCANVSVLGLGGGITPFAFNFTLPPDFAQLTPSLFRVDAGARGITFAALLDHGYGASPLLAPRAAAARGSGTTPTRAQRCRSTPSPPSRT